MGGYLSDRFGRRATMGLLTALTPFLIYSYLWLEDGSWYILPLLALAGTVTMAPRTIVLAAGSELLPEARGPMAGMLLALGFVSMSVAAIVFGALADRIGIVDAYEIMPLLWFLALPCILLLPRRGAALAQPH